MYKKHFRITYGFLVEIQLPAQDSTATPKGPAPSLQATERLSSTVHRERKRKTFIKSPGSFLPRFIPSHGIAGCPQGH